MNPGTTFLCVFMEGAMRRPGPRIEVITDGPPIQLRITYTGGAAEECELIQMAPSFTLAETEGKPGAYNLHPVDPWR